MKSAVAISHLIDYGYECAEELAKQIKKNLILEKNSVGLLFCDYDADILNIAAGLNKELGIDIYGCTMSNAISYDGLAEICAELIVLTSDDASFACEALSGYTADTVGEVLVDSYNRLKCRLGADPDFIFVIPNHSRQMPDDNYLTILSEASGNLPVFGAIASGDINKTDMFCTFDQHSLNYGLSVSVILVKSDTKPRFVMCDLGTLQISDEITVTKSASKIIYELDGIPAIDKIEQLGYIDCKGLANGNDFPQRFAAMPIIVDPGKKIDGARTSYLRVMDNGDFDTGALYLSNSIPSDNRRIAFCKITCEDLLENFKNAVLEVKEIIEAGSYSTMLCFSCITRASILANRVQNEAALISEILPPISTAGFYSFGEICPAVGNDSVHNRFHNCNVIFCVL